MACARLFTSGGNKVFLIPEKARKRRTTVKRERGGRNTGIEKKNYGKVWRKEWLPL